jgi:hypothetical protein
VATLMLVDVLSIISINDEMYDDDDDDDDDR